MRTAFTLAFVTLAFAFFYPAIIASLVFAAHLFAN